jgi:hypothetical protein
MAERREWQEREDEEVRLRWQEREDDPRVREQVDEARARFLKRLRGELDELRRVERERRFKWEQRVEQGLNVLLARREASVVVTPPAPMLVKERTVLGLQRAYPPHGIPPKGTVWDEVDRRLLALGTKTSRTTYFAALKHIRENLACTTSDQS